MPSDAVNAATRREWRDLGFFYDIDHSRKEWRIIGSFVGLQKFATLVREYASRPPSVKIGEHAHFGPYGCLEVGTFHSAVITDHWIAGPIPELQRLSDLISKILAGSNTGDSFKLRASYSPSSPYELSLEVRNDDFDPAAEDAAIC